MYSKTWCAASAVIFALLFVPASGAARSAPGELDQSFGTGGRITRTLRPEDRGRLQFATDPEGEVLLATGRTIVRYRRDGKLDRSFGNEGRVVAKGPPGTQFEPADIAVDSRGRVIVTGTGTSDPVSYVPGPSGGVSLQAQFAIVIRYTSDGELDRSFAAKGILSSTLGLRPPDGYGAPVVTVVGVAIDSKARAVLTGTSIRKMGGCRGSFYGHEPVYEGFVARLTANGSPDSSFADGAGIRPIKDLEDIGKPLIDPGDGVVYTGESDFSCPVSGLPTLGRLDASGHPALSFGPEGWKTIAEVRESDEEFGADLVALDDRRRILLVRMRHIETSAPVAEVARLQADGAPDATFGRRGIATVRLGNLTNINAIAADEHGRVLLAGSRARRRCVRCNPGRGSGPISVMALFRLSPKGKLDRDFGNDGTVLTGFPGFGRRTKAAPIWISASRGDRILVGGFIESPHFSTGNGVALTRYLSASPSRPHQ